MTFGKNNKLVAFKAEGGQFFSLESLHLQMISTSLIYPDKAVKSGDKWETEYENPVVKDKKFKVETTYVGKETVDKEELFKLTQKMEADGDENGTKTKVQMTFWLDKEGGIVKSEQKAEGIVTTMAAIDWTATTERIKEKAKEKPADK